MSEAQDTSGARKVRVGVVGHVEHVEFVRVERVPLAGEIVHARGSWVEAAGGGGVAAVQLAKLAGACDLFTALGDDERGRAAPALFAAHAPVRVHAAWRSEPQRRAITFVDDAAERTITVIGQRHQPEAQDLAGAAALPWHLLDGADAVYFTAGAPEALRAVRDKVRVVVATARVLPLLEQASALGVAVDVIVRSRHDPGEPDPGPAIAAGRILPPRLVVATEGGLGGAYVERDVDAAKGVVREGRWVAAPLPGPPVDAYGCGDSFAAGLTFALGSGLDTDAALAFAARCGAACLTGAGPYAAQLRLVPPAGA